MFINISLLVLTIVLGMYVALKGVAIFNKLSITYSKRNCNEKIKVFNPSNVNTTELKL